MARNTWTGKAPVVVERLKITPSNVIPGMVVVISDRLSKTITVTAPDGEPSELPTRLAGLIAKEYPDMASVTSDDGVASVLIRGLSDGSSLGLSARVDGIEDVIVEQVRAGSPGSKPRVEIHFPRKALSGDYVIHVGDKAARFNAKTDLFQFSEAIGCVGKGVAFGGDKLTLCDIDPSTPVSVDCSEVRGISGIFVSNEPATAAQTEIVQFTIPAISIDSLWHIRVGENRTDSLPVTADSEAIRKSLAAVGIASVSVIVKRTASKVFTIEFLGEPPAEQILVVNARGESTPAEVIQQRSVSTPARAVIGIAKEPLFSGTYRIISVGEFETADIAVTATALQVADALNAVSGDVRWSAEGDSLKVVTRSDGVAPRLVIDASQIFGGSVPIGRTPGVAPVNAMQHISSRWKLAPPDGMYRFRFSDGRETPWVSYDATEFDVQGTLTDVLGEGNVRAVGSLATGILIEFIGELAGKSIDPIQVVTSSLVFKDRPSVKVECIERGTGPKDFRNPLNWSLQQVPQRGDNLVFDAGTVDCVCHDVIESPASIEISRGYGGIVDLRYRSRDDDDRVESTQVTIGRGDSGDIPKLVKLNFGEQAFAATVLSSGKYNGKHGVVLTGSNPENDVLVRRGYVAIGTEESPAKLAALTVEPLSAKTKDLAVDVMQGTVVETARVSGGTVQLQTPPGTIYSAGDSYVEILGESDGDHRGRNVHVSGGKIYWAATGSVGRGGEIGSIALDIAGDPIVCSPGHGLSDGNIVYMQGTGQDWADNKAFTIWVVDKHHFGLIVGSNASPTACVRGSWGLAESVKASNEGTLQFTPTPRICRSPIVVGSGSTLIEQGSIQDLVVWSSEGARLNLGPDAELRRFKR